MFQTLQLKKAKAYEHLLDQGTSLIDNASTQKDKLDAMENQRRNLETSVVDKAEDWAGINRNKDANSSNLLEGIVIS